MKIYLAGPLFNPQEREYNLGLTHKLETLGYKVFLPQRDGVERENPQYMHMGKDEKRRALFTLDRDELLTSNALLILLNGRTPDEGACVELGMAYAWKFANKAKITLIGLHTDTRAAFIGARLNPMLSIPLDFLATSEDLLYTFLTKLQKE